ncbi:MAG: hypothetical protein ACRD9W_01515 [Terriglobia bacterium]
MKLHQNTGRAIRGETTEQTLYELAHSAQTSAQMMTLEVMLGASQGKFGFRGRKFGDGIVIAASK